MNGQEVREIRDKLGFTQEQLAREVGVHKNTVARWERNELAIRESTARLLAFVVSGVRERGLKPG
ncbi:MAG: helix-turn-helix domain-containing protein [Vicinamibacterales bacterium]